MANVGVAQNFRARVTQVSVFGSIYQGAILEFMFLSQAMSPSELNPPHPAQWPALASENFSRSAGLPGVRS